jgi:NAD(P)-dependent dehydrogenase (short-subunit alcohol dehydrogenase family)
VGHHRDAIASLGVEEGKAMGHLEGKVAVVTGAGRGIGRCEALALAAEGASVVVNDMGGSWQGDGADNRPASEVAEEIIALGGKAAGNFDNVADPAGAQNLIKQAIDTFGRLDILVNNAGILRDAMVFSADPAEWSSVIDVHVKGHFLPTRYATEYWREEGKKGNVSHRAIVNTTSESGLFGNAGQSNYDLAKMGIVSFTIAVSKELAKYQVTCNAIAPRARTRLTTTTFENSDRAAEFSDRDPNKFDDMDPENIAPFVTFLGTENAADITGQTFVVWGGVVAHVKLPQVADYIVKSGRWTIDEIAEKKDELFKNLGPNVYEGPKGYARLPKH